MFFFLPTSKLKWVDDFQMDEFLGYNTHPVRKPRAGDILVCRDPGDQSLSHTAIVVEPKSKKFCHKPGLCDLEIASLAEIKETYDNTVCSYHRFKPRKA
jgi:hypothetical protein